MSSSNVQPSAALTVMTMTSALVAAASDLSTPLKKTVNKSKPIRSY